MKDPPAARDAAVAAATRSTRAVLTTGRRAYTQYCAACHGADQRGAIAGVPSLVGVTDRIDQESFRVIVSEGRNNMRPIVDASNEEIRGDLHVPRRRPIRPAAAVAAAAAAARGARPPLPPGPVVAQRRRAAPAAAGALRRPVLSRRRRHGRQHAVAGGCRRREAADAVSDRLQRDGARRPSRRTRPSPPTT